MKPKEKKVLLGMGLDSDGEARVTRGENFLLVGGKAETHENMQEKAVKFNEKLRERGRSLDDIGRDEAMEIAAEIDVKFL